MSHIPYISQSLIGFHLYLIVLIDLKKEKKNGGLLWQETYKGLPPEPAPHIIGLTFNYSCTKKQRKFGKNINI